MADYSNLYKRTNYTIDCSYVLNTSIYEYDMKSAGMNILYSLGLIDENSYEYLSNLPKTERNIQIGYLQKENKQLTKQLAEGFKEYRRQFFEANNIMDDDIVSIKKDALFIMRPINVTVFDSVVFVVKNIYTSLFKTLYLELYYDSTHNVIDIKGINDARLKKDGLYSCFNNHNDYMLKQLKYLFKLKETNPSLGTSEFIKFAVSYKNKELNSEFYRMLSGNPVFVTDLQSMLGSITLKEYDPEFELDISYNYNAIISPIAKIMLD